MSCLEDGIQDGPCFRPLEKRFKLKVLSLFHMHVFFYARTYEKKYTKKLTLKNHATQQAKLRYKDVIIT